MLRLWKARGKTAGLNASSLNMPNRKFPSTKETEVPKEGVETQWGNVAKPGTRRTPKCKERKRDSDGHRQCRTTEVRNLVCLYIVMSSDPLIIRPSSSILALSPLQFRLSVFGFFCISSRPATNLHSCMSPTSVLAKRLPCPDRYSPNRRLLLPQ